MPRTPASPRTEKPRRHSRLYVLLGVSRSAGPDEIKRAYRAKAKVAHPDGGGSVDDFAAVNRAYRVLADPKAREKYDATGEIDEGEPDTAEARALNQISWLLVRVLFAERDLTGLDVVAILKQALTDRIAKAEAALALQQRARKRLKKMKGRFHATSGEHNALSGMLDWQGEYVGKRAAALEGEIADMKRAQQILADYRYQPEAAPVMARPDGWLHVAGDH